MSRSHVLFPLLTSTSVIAIDSYFFDGANMTSSLGVLIGTQIPHITEFLRIKAAGKNEDIDKVKYYLNRTEESAFPMSAEIYQDLERKKITANVGLGVNMCLCPPAIAALQIATGGFPTSILGIAFTHAVKDLSTKWRVKRALDGAWSVDKEPPKEPVKEASFSPNMMPA